MAVIELQVPIEAVEDAVRDRHSLHDSVEVIGVEFDEYSEELIFKVLVDDSEFDLHGIELNQVCDAEFLEDVF